MKKKLLGLALGLSALASVQMYQSATAQAAVGIAVPTDISQINPDQLVGLVKKLRGRLEQHMPVIQQFIAKVQAGDYEGLRTYLKAQSANLDVGAALSFLGDHVGQLKVFLAKALDRVPKNLDAFPLPADMKVKLPQAVQMVQNNLNRIDQIPTLLEKARPMINLPANIDFIVDKLKEASGSEQFQAFVPHLQSLGESLDDSWNEFKNVNYQIVADGIKELIKQQQGKPFNLILVIQTLGIIRRLVPHVLNIARGSVSLAVDLGDALGRSGVAAQLPAELRTPLETVRTHASALLDHLQDANELIEKMKAALPIPVGMVGQ